MTTAPSRVRALSLSLSRSLALPYCVYACVCVCADGENNPDAAGGVQSSAGASGGIDSEILTAQCHLNRANALGRLGQHPQVRYNSRTSSFPSHCLRID